MHVSLNARRELGASARGIDLYTREDPEYPLRQSEGWFGRTAQDDPVKIEM